MLDNTIVLHHNKSDTTKSMEQMMVNSALNNVSTEFFTIVLKSDAKQPTPVISSGIVENRKKK